MAGDDHCGGCQRHKGDYADWQVSIPHLFRFDRNVGPNSIALRRRLGNEPKTPAN